MAGTFNLCTMSQPTTLERAFQLARAGAYATVDELARVLKKEQHDLVDAHLAGPTIRRDLRRILDAGQCTAAASGAA